MTKIDLITGFLGSGKTTFIKKYVEYLKSLNEKICIIENDFGAVNIDLMLVKDLNVDIEMVSGGCDYDCHLRRYKTKLIALMRKGYTRIIVEPSGIYDTDEFFDVLYEEPLIDSYTIGNVFCMYDINTKNLDNEEEYVLVSEASNASKLIVSKRDGENIALNLEYINSLFKKYHCEKLLSQNNIVYTDNLNFSEIINSGYRSNDHMKLQVMNENSFESLYILDKDISLSKIEDISRSIFESKYGNVIRLKGFIRNCDKYYSINLTKENKIILPSLDGQNVLIIIGKNLNKELINNLFD